MEQAAMLFDNKVSKEILVSVLERRHRGAKNGVCCKDLVTELTGSSDKGSERRVRTLITELRLEGIEICGTPETGYFMAANTDELERTRNHLYSRSMTGLRQVAAMGKKALPDLAGQLGIGEGIEA